MDQNAADLAQNKRGRNKKKVIIGFVVLCTVCIVSIILLQNPHWLSLSYWDQDVTSMYSDKIVSYDFYPTDYTLDVTADEEYMSLDHSLYYTFGNETMGLTPEEYADYGPAVSFFGNYFQTIIAGDAETYNTFFTDNYYKTNKPYAMFAPQMLYDMRIVKLREEAKDDGTTIYAFNVEYKIHRNDGTFRNDMGSDASKVLYYELIGYNNVVKIDRITYYIE